MLTLIGPRQRRNPRFALRTRFCYRADGCRGTGSPERRKSSPAAASSATAATNSRKPPRRSSAPPPSSFSPRRQLVGSTTFAAAAAAAAPAAASATRTSAAGGSRFSSPSERRLKDEDSSRRASQLADGRRKGSLEADADKAVRGEEGELLSAGESAGEHEREGARGGASTPGSPSAKGIYVVGRRGNESSRIHMLTLRNPSTGAFQRQL